MAQFIGSEIFFPFWNEVFVLLCVSLQLNIILLFLLRICIYFDPYGCIGEKSNEECIFGMKAG